MDLSFLPDLPHSSNILTSAAVILFAGILGAFFITRFFPKIPTITGYILAGLLIGPMGLRLIDSAALDSIIPFIDLGLGLVLFELGRRVDFSWLCREKRLLIGSIIFSITVFMALLILMKIFSVNNAVAIMIAAIGMASSPAVILNLVREYGAEGQLSERMLNIVAIGNVLAFVGFSMGLSAAHLEYQTGWHNYIFHPLYLFGGSIILAWLASKTLIGFSHLFGRDAQRQLVLTLAMIAALAGISALFNLSAIIALLAFGIISRSRDLNHVIVEADFSQFSTIAYVFLFVFGGAKIEFQYLIKYWPFVVSFIVLRLLITIFMSTILAHFYRLSMRNSILLGIGLIPLSGFKIILLQNSITSPYMGAEWISIVLLAVGILELIGPICTRYTLFACGEARRKGGYDHVRIQQLNAINFGHRT